MESQELTQAVERMTGVLERVEKMLASNLLADVWPKTVAQFATYAGRSERTVQEWIDRGILKANTKVRPALITKGQAAQFMEGRG